MQVQPPVNLKEYKTGLRARYKELRRAMPPEQKDAADRRIADRLSRLGCYRRCSTLLTYVSSPIEVGTREIIARALADGKRVAVPRCVPGPGRWNFISSRAAMISSRGLSAFLSPGPVRRGCSLNGRAVFALFLRSPATAKDTVLGYGGGYYDRFLRNFPGVKALILYKKCLVEHIWHGRYDVAVDLIVTEYFTHAVAHACSPGRMEARPHSAAAKRPPKAK